MRASRFRRFLPILAVILAAAGPVAAVRAQIALTKVSAAAVADSTLSPGDTLTVNFLLATGSSPAARVEFAFGYGVVASTTSPAGGVATCSITHAMRNGDYTLQSIVVHDHHGRVLTFGSTGSLVTTPPLSGVAAAPGPTPDYAGVKFTLSGSTMAFSQLPALVSVARTSPATVTAGSPVVFQFVASSTSSPLVTGAVRLATTNGDDFVTEFTWNAGTVTIPTSTDWSNGEYHIVSLFIRDLAQERVYLPNDGSGLLSNAQNFTLTGGLVAPIYPVLTNLAATGGATLNPGQTRGLSFTATSAAGPLASVVAEYQDATGFVVSSRATGANSGTVSFTAGSDWVNGPHGLKTITLTDPVGRRTVYSRDQNRINLPASVGGTHAFDFSAFDFSVSNAIASPPFFATQPSDRTVTPLQGTLLLCEVVSPAGYPITYQWYAGQPGDTSQPTGPNSSRFSISELPSTTAFWVRATTLAGSVDSTVATVTILYESNLPKIYRQPLPVAQHVATRVSAEVFAVGPGPLAYQWYKDGAAVAGATSARITFESMALADNGTYAVRITNSYGSVTSEAVALTGTDRPAITTQPVGQTANYGDSVTFSVAATGGNLSYLWRINGAFLAAAIGNGTPTYTVPSVDGSHAGTVTVYISNTEGSVTSAPVTLTVVGGPRPAFGVDATAYGTVNRPFNLSLLATPNVTLLTATGLPAGLTLDPGGEIRGTPTATGTFPVTIIATNAGGSTTFQLTLTIFAGSFAPVFTRQPASVTAALHASVTFTAAATGTDLTRYQWNFNGQPIAGAFHGTYTIAEVSPANAGEYTLDATGAVGTTRSSGAVLTVDTAHSAPFLVGDQSLYQVNLLASAGDSVTLGANIGGTSPVSYQWVKDYAELPGANQSTLTLTDIPVPGTYATYQLKAMNAHGTKTFEMGALTRSDAPRISPAMQTITAGQDATITVQSPLAGSRYQWYRGPLGDSSQPIAGATAATLTVTALQASTDFWVVMFPTYNAYAMGASVRVAGNPSGIAVSQQPAAVAVTAGGSAFFSVTASASSALSYQWRRNGAPLAGQTGSTLALNGVTLADSGAVFDVVVTSGTGTVTSSGAILTVVAAADLGRVFFGSISGGGQFALYDRGTGAGVIIGSFGSGRGSFVVKFAIAADGSFTVALPTGSTGTAWPADTGRPPVKPAASVTLSGRISGGSLSGSIASTSETLTGSLQSSGSTAAMAGYYEAPMLDSTTGGVLSFIVGASGTVIGGAATGSAVQVATGTISGDGQFGVTFGLGMAVTGTINAATGGLSGSVTTNGIAAGRIGGLAAGVARTDRLVNLSTRGLVGDGEKAMFAGFVISGSQPKGVLVRASGPTLADYGLAGVMDNPVLRIFRGNTEIMGNDDWGASPDAGQLPGTAARLGAFAQKAGSRDAALVATLAPGVYTAQVNRASGSATGVALVEIYDAGLNPGTEAQKVINISTRGEVGTGEGIMVAGFVISGNVPKKVLIRAVGPTLANYGVGNPLANPQVALYRRETVIATNDNWGDGAGGDAISEAAAQVGGFPLVAGSRDSALLLTLAPGLYSAQVSGVGASTGIALLEVYEVP